MPVGSWVSGFQQLQLLGGIFERIQDVLQATPEPKPQVPADLTGLAVTVENVSFSYGIHSPLVLNDISLHVCPGQKVALVGQTGCGKTTLAKLLVGLYQPTQGTIAFGGVDIKDVDLQVLRQKLGVVLQETFLFNDTIARNIAYRRPIIQAEIERAARLAHLDEDIALMPMRYHTLVGENGQNLSGGQRQKLAIARALAGRPSILLMDEATNQLDSHTEYLIEKSLCQCGITRIVITHRLETLADADLIIVLDRGRIVEQGTYGELTRQHPAFPRMGSPVNVS